MTLPSTIADRTFGEYLDTLGSDAPAPGGGSVTGVLGALAAALGQMVLNVTSKGAPDPDTEGYVERLAERVQQFLAGAEADEAAYGEYVTATKLPKSSADEKAARRQALQEALHASARAPLAIATNAADLLDDLLPVIERGAKNILSDADIAILIAETTVAASMVNLRVNLPLIKDPAIAAGLGAAGEQAEAHSRVRAQRCREALAARRAS